MEKYQTYLAASYCLGCKSWLAKFYLQKQKIQTTDTKYLQMDQVKFEKWKVEDSLLEHFW